ncbi:lysophosphatidic acid receptor 3-like [Elgaria multicarinata webbii]|uniref:lysophosphatidic acid receptor 3-like n=1 Tax=Elgaria multicarinata webbii TaxID=159646 RepID=UPI002FCD323F
MRFPTENATGDKRELIGYLCYGSSLTFIMLPSHTCVNRTTHVWSWHLVLSLGVPQLTITFISVVFNSAIIFSVAHSKDLHKPIFILFCNLALSDLLSSASGFWIALVFVTNPQSTIVGSSETLRAYAFYATSILATIYNLVAIGIERYLAVVESLKSRCWITRNQTFGISLLIWLFSSFLGFMPLMGWNCLDRGNISALYSPLCIDYLVFLTIPNCAVALILPFFTYFNIISFLRKHKLAMGVLGQARPTYRLAEIQVAKTSVFIWLLALFSYAPFFIGVVFDSATQRCPSELPVGVYVFRNLTAMMITINSLGNPIIYTLNVKRLGRRLKSLKRAPKNRIAVQAIGDA